MIHQQKKTGINKRFDVEGYVTRDWLKENVPYTDADFYFCGPVPFMKVMNQSLLDLGVNENRINFEFFGPKGSLEVSEKSEPVLV